MEKLQRLQNNESITDTGFAPEWINSDKRKAA
jgi:hypothetical protein